MQQGKTKQQQALDYHSEGRPGKIKVVPTKNTKTQRDLSLAYSPGVAEPCMAIFENKEDVYKYTAKGNLVAVISNGTAVLGLGNIGPEASKPVMEGKALLFKIYADIDVFDLELDTSSVEEFITVVKALGPTFGGINLEDIKAPECFEIERRLKEVMDIPVMHDDQHGTAIISSAALLNALDIVGKKIENVSIVVSGAGAAALACIRLYVSLGASKANILMFDKDGVISTSRTDLDESRLEFVRDTSITTLAEAMVNADVFLGLSAGNIVSSEMVKSMAKDPIVFAMANPNPEISFEQAKAAREDVIMATGRSDYPNQVNNVLGFPYIFRGALDVNARQINEEMKLAAVYAIAELARLPVPDKVNVAYGEQNLVYGRDYIIPKPMDPRLLQHIAPAVAKAAIASNVARKDIEDWDLYKEELGNRIGLDNSIVRVINQKARKNPKRVVFAEADNLKILKAAQIVESEGIGTPILLGSRERIHALMSTHHIEMNSVNIIDLTEEVNQPLMERFGELFYQKRHRKGYTVYEARKVMRERNYFGCMMVETGMADALISGLTRSYPDTIRPALQIIGMQEGSKKVAGMYIVLTPKGPLFLADATVNLDPSSDELVDITLQASSAVKFFGVIPRIAMLSYSNFGSSSTPEAKKVRDAVRILKMRDPDMLVDGEVQASVAFDQALLKENYPFSELIGEGVNTLIFPNLSSGNIAYNLLKEVAGFDIIGPILMGLKKPVHILQLGSTVDQIVSMTAMAVVDAQDKLER